MGRELSILLFGTQMAIGGAQKVLLDQARWFQSHGHRVTAVFFYDKQGLHSVWQERLGIPLLTMTALRGDGFFRQGICPDRRIAEALDAAAARSV